MKARVQVVQKADVFDPQGEAVRQGKVIELDLDETDPARARDSVTAMCERLLANTVIESYRIEIG